jgi:multidrug transporter EmrE-like cation transporter
MLKHVNLNTKTIFIFLSLFFQSLSVIFGKFASLSIKSITFQNLILNPFYLLTLGCLFLQAITWQQTLRYFPLSYSYMFMSGIYPVIMLSSIFIFHETVTVFNLIGTVIILVGILNLFTTRR